MTVERLTGRKGGNKVESAYLDELQKLPKSRPHSPPSLKSSLVAVSVNISDIT
jgi:hypothetical protein